MIRVCHVSWNMCENIFSLVCMCVCLIVYNISQISSICDIIVLVWVCVCGFLVFHKTTLVAVNFSSISHHQPQTWKKMLINDLTHRHKKKPWIYDVWPRIWPRNLRHTFFTTHTSAYYLTLHCQVHTCMKRWTHEGWNKSDVNIISGYFKKKIHTSTLTRLCCWSNFWCKVVSSHHHIQRHIMFKTCPSSFSFTMSHAHQLYLIHFFFFFCFTQTHVLYKLQ